VFLYLASYLSPLAGQNKGNGIRRRDHVPHEWRTTRWRCAQSRTIRCASPMNVHPDVLTLSPLPLMTAGRFMVCDLKICVHAQVYSTRWSGVGFWLDKYAFRPLAEMGTFSDQSTSTAAMASIPLTVTRVVNTQTSVVCKVCSRVVPPLMCCLGPAPARAWRG
jgi:hypothetical protein